MVCVHLSTQSGQSGLRLSHGPGQAFLRATLAFDDLPHIDAIIISHDHYDHLTVPPLRGLLSAILTLSGSFP